MKDTRTEEVSGFVPMNISHRLRVLKVKLYGSCVAEVVHASRSTRSLRSKIRATRVRALKFMLVAVRTECL